MIPIYSAAGFDIVSTLFDENINNGNNTIGVKLEMTRRLKPFFLKYYVPAVAIVIVSEISFLIPVVAIPGRIGLLVTMFLTLTNLFIYNMVSVARFFGLNYKNTYITINSFIILTFFKILD